MPLSKKRNKDRMRLIRGSVQPTCNLESVQPNEPSRLVQPNVRAYSKEDQVKTFGQLKKQFDYRRG